MSLSEERRKIYHRTAHMLSNDLSRNFFFGTKQKLKVEKCEEEIWKPITLRRLKIKTFLEAICSTCGELKNRSFHAQVKQIYYSELK